MRSGFIRGGVVLAVVLGCGGVGPDEPAPVEVGSGSDSEAWLDQAVADALEFETMPGTEPEPTSAAREDELRAFFRAHPEYRDPEERAKLGLHACGLEGVEAAHRYLQDPPPKEPLVIVDDRAAWTVFVAHADNHCTSDDWGWYASEANQAATARGAVIGYAGPENDVVVVQSQGREVARIPVSGQAFVIARAGKAPGTVPYEPGAIEPAIEDYLR